MKIEVEVTEAQVKEALDRQVRVVVGHMFETKEIQNVIQGYVRISLAQVMKEVTAEFPMETIRSMFALKLKEEVDKKVRNTLTKF